MKKPPIGPIVIGIALLGLIGGFLLLPAKPPSPRPTLSVVTAPQGVANAVQPPAKSAPAMSPAANATAPLAPGEDPPARREPGAINYADKGVLPAL